MYQTQEQKKTAKKTHLWLLMQVTISNMKKFTIDIVIYITRGM